MMDGMTRRQITIPPMNIRRDKMEAITQDKDRQISAYIVGGRDALKTWTRMSSIVVLIPNELGWKSKDLRILADEIAYFHQAIVVIPDIVSTSNRNQIFDDIISVMHKTMFDYDSKSIALAGFGIGGGIALEIATDLTDLNSLSMMLWENNSISSSQNVLNDKNNQIEDAVVVVNEIDRKYGKKAKELQLIHKFSSLSHDQLKKIVPTGLFVISPSDFNFERVSNGLRTPTFVVLGEKNSK